MLTLLDELRQQHLIGDGEFYFAKLIADKQQAFNYPIEIQQLAILVAALCYAANQQGDTCFFLQAQNEHNFFGLTYRALDKDYQALIQQKINYLPISQWQSALQEHIAFTTEPKQKKAPFVFQFDAIYLYRYWQDEGVVIDYLKRAVQNSQDFSADLPHIQQILAQLFPVQESEVNWQKVAVATAIKQPFCLITGGPGTGKTTTVFRLLAALQLLQQVKDLPLLRIQLVAPTGKAAARLTESLRRTLAQESSAIPGLHKLIPEQSSTLHRLLGVHPFNERTHFHAANPLPLDVLVVDEASMIDLNMMAKLLLALPHHAKLILLGDKDQLSSVEAGAILGELGQFLQQVEQDGYSPSLAQYLQHASGEHVPVNKHPATIGDYLCSLRKSYRFHEASGIGHLAKAINSQQEVRSYALFSQYDDIEFISYQQDSAYGLAQIIKSAVDTYQEYLLKIKQNKVMSPQVVSEIFMLFNRCRFLTALRGGDFGVESLNTNIAFALRQKRLVQFTHARDWFIGKPIMVTENDNNVGIYNGDIGLFLVDEEGQGRVWFEQGEKQFRSLPASRVPSHEMAFAMTVHKSQGSEFEHTCFILPTEFNPLLSKELVYTAVTRAKSKLTVFGQEQIWKSAVKNRTQRQSGLERGLSTF
ncbi:exodeoxyribonuclease V subunit alpha [Conservatibacter flavescens]|uniref:RecBCD enzyme subunit RecD n=1 Tax=Conservatibacter flavescens TaxID=28161 RepID=A0A2M8S5R1_9PAST|nr:exodeoxyribonuclease V subunit alpha [Conservatibacter flavescens]PJG86464.1 exodeoxyribonuclease V subunit alpha [Conservatibacter flavescens]